MALDKLVIGSRLATLEEHLRLLGEFAPLEVQAFVFDPRNYGAAERFLQLAIECVLDIGAHIISALGLERPNRYREICPPSPRLK